MGLLENLVSEAGGMGLHAAAGRASAWRARARRFCRDRPPCLSSFLPSGKRTTTEGCPYGERFDDRDFSPTSGGKGDAPGEGFFNRPLPTPPHLEQACSGAPYRGRSGQRTGKTPFEKSTVSFIAFIGGDSGVATGFDSLIRMDLAAAMLRRSRPSSSRTRRRCRRPCSRYSS